MDRFLIVVEKTSTGYSAYSPDIPGCIATGKSRAQIRRRMEEALAMHLQGLEEDGITVPKPSASALYVTAR